MGCHKEGMIPFTDTIRPAYENRAGDVAEKVRRIYPPAEAMARAVARDREQFLAAVRQAVEPFLRDAAGKPLDPATLPEPITDVSKRYDLNLAVADVARELGLPADRTAAEQAGLPVAAAELPTVIRASDDLGRLELAPLVAGERIKRSQWERANQRVSRQLRLGIPFQVQ